MNEQALEDWSYRFFQDNKDLLQRFLLIRKLTEDPEWADLPVPELLRLAKIKIYGKIKESTKQDESIEVGFDQGLYSYTFLFRLAIGRFADL